MINPQPGAAVFEQLAAKLREHVTSGKILPGKLLPSETSLQQEFGVSRQTARAAVNVLRAEGLAELVRGRGVVVREPAELEDLTVPPGSTITGRMPTAEERAAYDIGEGVPLMMVTAADGTVETYPADRYRLRLPR